MHNVLCYDILHKAKCKNLNKKKKKVEYSSTPYSSY